MQCNHTQVDELEHIKSINGQKLADDQIEVTASCVVHPNLEHI